MIAEATATRAVRIVEVSPRDGLQNIHSTIATDTKLELIRRLYVAGIQSVEITSLVSPVAVPQLADAEKVLCDPAVQARLKDPAVRAPVLVPNMQGLERALRSGVREVAVFVSASEGFSRANIRCSVAEGLLRAGKVAKCAIENDVAVRGYVSCVFADPYDGPTMQKDVFKVVQALLDMGCYEVSLGDTLGVGTPAEVRSLLGHLDKQGVPLERLAGHFHDTFGQAVANVWEAYSCGVRIFDSSVSGLGGCPFAPDAKGNVATEDVVYMFEQAGIRTGVSLEQINDIGMWISLQLKQPNHSRAGTALFAKRHTTKTSTSAQKPVRLTWIPVNETQDLQIVRSGVNMKLILNRPKNGNALTTAMISDLTQFFEKVATDRSVRRVVIAGQGKFFCTGMDLGKGTSPVAQGQQESDAQYLRLTRLLRLIDQAPQVTIAGINGPAFGGGVGLAFACDIRLATQNAFITLSEVRLGLSAATISKYVVRELGFAFSREAMLSARSIKAAELERIGSIAKVVPDDHLDEVLDTYLTQLSYAAPGASTMSKRLVNLGWVYPGSDKQERGIKDLFDKMMQHDGEAAMGLKLFQSKGKVYWDDQASKGIQAKI